MKLGEDVVTVALWSLHIPISGVHEYETRTDSYGKDENRDINHLIWKVSCLDIIQYR